MKPGVVLMVLALPALAACGERGLFARAPAPAPAAPAPAPAVEAALPPAEARTPEEFDTTTAAERAAASAPEAGGRALGRTVASLGDPARPGFWLETPLAKAPGQGRVSDPATGASVQVELIPIAGPEGAGSRISLAALRLLGLPLTALAELEVFGP